MLTTKPNFGDWTTCRTFCTKKIFKSFNNILCPKFSSVAYLSSVNQRFLVIIFYLRPLIFWHNWTWLLLAYLGLCLGHVVPSDLDPWLEESLGHLVDVDAQEVSNLLGHSVVRKDGLKQRFNNIYLTKVVRANTM